MSSCRCPSVPVSYWQTCQWLNETQKKKKKKRLCFNEPVHHILLPFLFCGRLALVDCRAVSWWKRDRDLQQMYCAIYITDSLMWTYIICSIKNYLFVFFPPQEPQKRAKDRGWTVGSFIWHLAECQLWVSRICQINSWSHYDIDTEKKKNPHIHKARTSESLLFLAWSVSLVHQFGSD